MNGKRLLHLVRALGLLVPLTAGADDLLMGVEDLPYLPYYASERGQYQGYARELFDAFATDRGHRIRYRALPVERLYHSLLHGDIDLKFPDSPDWRPELKADRAIRYSAPVAPFVDGVMVRPNRLADDPDVLRRIGTIRGFTPWPLLERIAEGKAVMSENNSTTGLLRQVIAGRVDGAFINVAVARFHLKDIEGDPDALALHPGLPATRSGYRVSTLHHPDLLAELDAWLADHQDQVAGLRRKWGIEE